MNSAMSWAYTALRARAAPAPGPGEPFMSEQKTNPIKRHSRTVALGSAAAIVLVGLSAFAFVPGVRPVSDTTSAPRLVAAAEPTVRTTPRMLENGAPFSFADLVERV